MWGVWTMRTSRHWLLGGYTMVTYLENAFTFPYKVKHFSLLWTRHSTWFKVTQEDENTYPHKEFAQNVHSSFTHTCQKLKVSQITINRWIDRKPVYAMKYHSVIKRNVYRGTEWHRWIPHKHDVERQKPGTKGQMLDNFIYTEFSNRET